MYCPDCQKPMKPRYVIVQIARTHKPKKYMNYYVCKNPKCLVILRKKDRHGNITTIRAATL